MSDLLDDIDALTELADLRAEAAGMRDAGARAMLEEPYGSLETILGRPGDRIERGLCLRVLYLAEKRRLERPKVDRSAENLRLWLSVGSKTMSPRGARDVSVLEFREEWRQRATLRDSPTEDHVPVLRAARALPGLLVTPGHKTDTAVWHYLYRIAFELRRARDPAWTIGAAGAGLEAPRTAFITGECVRAILTLVKGLEHSAKLFAAEQARDDADRTLDELRDVDRWIEQERRRLDLSLHLTHRRLSLGALVATSADATIWRRNITAACKRLKRISIRLPGGEHDRLAHSLAMDLLEVVLASARECARRGANRARICEALARELRDFLSPTRNYLSSVLDAELAADANPNARVDLFELTFAATSYGAIRDEWEDDRLRRAADAVAAKLGERGILPQGRPIQTRPKGYKLHVISAEAIRALADLLTHTHASAAIRPDLVRRMLRLFYDTQVDLTAAFAKHAERRGAAPRDFRGKAWWSYEDSSGDGGAWWCTANAVLALQRIVRMLDHTLNARIARHFSAQRGELLTLDLDGLFYPDYGLTATPFRKVKKTTRDRSIAIDLQLLRAHLEGVKPEEPRTTGKPREVEPFWSLILHGPPGTGKTTLIEALAKTTGKQYFAVTPSDILIGGAENVERRARAVFHALSMLTDAVILFDEFDAIIRERDVEGGVPDGVFEFLTPGMLPKLKRLREAAEKQRVVFALATNLIGTLDDAAIRDGRFDRKVGIYPPDHLSRSGRLAWALAKMGKRPDASRFAKCVALGAGGAINALAKPDWFTPSKQGRSPREGTPLWYVPDRSTAGTKDVPKFPEPEALPLPSRPRGFNRHAVREWLEWLQVDAWDREPMSEAVFDSLTRDLKEPATIDFPPLSWPSIDDKFKRGWEAYKREWADNQALERARSPEWRRLLEVVERVGAAPPAAASSTPKLPPPRTRKRRA